MSCPSSTSATPLSPNATPANRFGWDYAALADDFPRLSHPIIDVHSHIGGLEATPLYKRACELYGVGLTYSMTQLEQVEAVRDLMEGRIRFIAVPNWAAEDKRHHLGRGFVERIEAFHRLGTRICKFWAAPRGTDYAQEFGEPNFMKLDAPHRIESMQAAYDLGMWFMTHVADPDTWFASKYQDASIYGTKRQQYEPLEELIQRFDRPWIAAHMGGWPEDLEFLSGLLDRHDNLYLDTSATKWMIRELSKHSRDDLINFLTRYRGRILFGSDIVTSDDHLHPAKDDTEQAAKASHPEEAFDLYASRYWALRTMWETDHEGESPIADPDLAMVDPEGHDEMDAPMLCGKSLPPELLADLYHDAAHNLLEPLYST